MMLALVRERLGFDSPLRHRIFSDRYSSLIQPTVTVLCLQATLMASLLSLFVGSLRLEGGGVHKRHDMNSTLQIINISLW